MSKQVVIIGAGVIGAFCAVRLAKAGARVTLLEAEPENYSARGPAASLAAAGMLSPIGLPPGPGDVGHPQYTELALASFDLWRAWSRDGAWADAVRFDGGVHLARDGDQAGALVARVQALGRTASALVPAQFRKRTRLGLRIEHSVLVEDEGVADPGRVLSGLALEAQRFGVVTRFSCDVAKIERDPLRAVSYGDETFEADLIVLAAGYVADQFAREAPVLATLRPAKGHMVPVALAEPLGATVHGPDFYIARRSGNEHVLGATMEWDRYDRGVDREKVQGLLNAAERALPGQVRHGEGHAWAGVRPMSPDGAPMIGPSGGMLVAAGHSRNGWLLAPITAEIITAHVFGADIPPLWQAFSPNRFGANTRA